MNSRERTLRRFYKKHKRPDLILKDITTPQLMCAMRECGLKAKAVAEAFVRFNKATSVSVCEAIGANNNAGMEN